MRPLRDLHGTCSGMYALRAGFLQTSTDLPVLQKTFSVELTLVHPRLLQFLGLVLGALPEHPWVLPEPTSHQSIAGPPVIL